MEAFSFVHWIIVLAVVGLYGYPLSLVVKRAGFSGWWAILWFLPLVNLIAIWIFATTRWPNQTGDQQASM